MEQQVCLTASAPDLWLHLGRMADGRELKITLTEQPHLLIAGGSGTGKSALCDAIMLSLLQYAPEKLRLILIDAGSDSFERYAALPQLATAPVFADPQRAVAALRWCVSEAERRILLFKARGVPDLKTYNEGCAGIKQVGEGSEPLAQLVVFIEDFSFLVHSDVSVSLYGYSSRALNLCCKLADCGSCCGIHLLLALKHPSLTVLSSFLRAKIPARIAFKLQTAAESCLMLDTPAAEFLSAPGAMLCKNLCPESRTAVSATVLKVTSEQISKACAKWQKGRTQHFIADVDAISSVLAALRQRNSEFLCDPALPAARTYAHHCLKTTGHLPSIAQLQRVLAVGWPRARVLMLALKREQELMSLTL